MNWKQSNNYAVYWISINPALGQTTALSKFTKFWTIQHQVCFWSTDIWYLILGMWYIWIETEYSIIYKLLIWLRRALRPCDFFECSDMAWILPGAPFWCLVCKACWALPEEQWQPFCRLHYCILCRVFVAIWYINLYLVDLVQMLK